MAGVDDVGLLGQHDGDGALLRRALPPAKAVAKSKADRTVRRTRTVPCSLLMPIIVG